MFIKIVRVARRSPRRAAQKRKQRRNRAASIPCPRCGMRECPGDAADGAESASASPVGMPQGATSETRMEALKIRSLSPAPSNWVEILLPFVQRTAVETEGKDS